MSFFYRIVSVGGDGTFIECVEGVLRNSSKELGIDLNDVSTTLPQTTLRLGAIAAGDQ